MSKERDGFGRFLPGHTAYPGPGRPPRVREEHFLEVLHSAISDERLIRMAEACCKRADEGDAISFRLLLSYLLGLPAQSIRIEGGRVVLEVGGAGPFKSSDSAVNTGTAGAAAVPAPDGTVSADESDAGVEE